MCCYGSLIAKLFLNNFAASHTIDVVVVALRISSWSSLLKEIFGSSLLKEMISEKVFFEAAIAYDGVLRSMACQWLSEDVQGPEVTD